MQSQIINVIIFFVDKVSNCGFPQSAVYKIFTEGVKGLANIKSSIKRIRLTKERTLRNRIVKSTVKTFVKKFEESIAAGKIDEAKKLYPRVSHVIDKAAAKGVLHRNTAARKKSKLALKLNRAM